MDWTTLGAVIAGLFILALQWAWSLPGYVWLTLVIILLLVRIDSQLAMLNANVYSLTQAVDALKSAKDDLDEDLDEDWDAE